LKLAKPFDISKQLVMTAFKIVKRNAGSAGIDQQSIDDFEANLKDNLYKIWNRMSSGTYFPPPVKAVPIPKKSGGQRILGIPTVSDRIAQTLVKLLIEPMLDSHFLSDSYGYRPNKSTLDAIAITRQRCFQYDWIIEYDIEGLFDNIDHTLLMKAVKKHITCKWILLYIERWLKTPTQTADGNLQCKTKGLMQGGVLSPILSNLFLHYVVDLWITRKYANVKWCRYADDGLMHCKTLLGAKRLLAAITKRFTECGLRLHPEKTKIIYCRDNHNKGMYPITQFDFLGFTFRKRYVKKKSDNTLFLSFTPAVSKQSLKAMKHKIKSKRYVKRTDMSIEEIAEDINPVLRGWINYYGRFNRSSLYPMLHYFNTVLVKWAMRKFKNSSGRTKVAKRMVIIHKQKPNLFVHWQMGITSAYA
jgi:RNA-directed DNA polymerase